MVKQFFKKDKNTTIASDYNENINSEGISSMVSFGMGDFIYEVFNGIFGAFFFLFWETEVKLDIWIVTFAYVIFANWNSANDPLIGFDGPTE
jgi:hypothetical protein